MRENEAFDLQSESLKQELKRTTVSKVEYDLAGALLDRDTLRELSIAGENRYKVSTILWGYFEHPTKWWLYRQLNEFWISKSSLTEQKKILFSIYNKNVTLEQLRNCPAADAHMEDYKVMRSIALPMLQKKISSVVYAIETDRFKTRNLKNTSEAYLDNRKIRSLKDLLVETEFYCQNMGIDFNRVMDLVELPFGPLIDKLLNWKRKVGGVLLQMEPLLAAELESSIIDRAHVFWKQLLQYEQWAYRWDVATMSQLVREGFLKEDLEWIEQEGFIAFLESLYDANKSIVDIPWPKKSNFKLAIANRSFGLPNHDNLKYQKYGDWDETLPLASIDIDVNASSNEVVGLLAAYFPEKFAEDLNWTENYGLVTLENKDIIELESIYLDAAHRVAIEEPRIIDQNLSDEKLFEQTQDEQFASGQKNDVDFIATSKRKGSVDFKKWTKSSDSMNEEDIAKWKMYTFAVYTNKIPPKLVQELKAEMWVNYPKNGPYAWIDQWKVHYNTKRIKELFGIEVAPNPDKKLASLSPLFEYTFNGKTMDDPELDTDSDLFRKFSAWKEQQKRHEILHRILWFNSIRELRVETVTWEDYVLTQEQLCSLAEIETANKTTSVTVDGKTYHRDTLEATIANALKRESFSFANIPQIDLESLEHYIAHGDEAFLNQLDANAGRTINPGEAPDAAAVDAILNDHIATSLFTAPKWRDNVQKSASIKVGNKKYVYVKRQPAWAPATGQWSEITPNPDDPKDPFVRDVTHADIAATVASMNAGTAPGAAPWTPGAAWAPWAWPAGGPAPWPATPEVADEFDFKTQFETTVDGDMNANFSKNTVLYIRKEDSSIPGYGGAWIKGEIRDIDETAKKFTLKLVGSTEWTLAEMQWHEIRIDMNEKGLKRIKQRGEVRKFTVKDNSKDFYDYITQKLDSDDKSVLSGKNAWSGQQIKWDNGQLLQKKYYDNSAPKYDVISAIGKIDTSNPKNTLLYKVERRGDSVAVTLDDPIRERTMDYNTFLMFIVDKKLSPYSGEQVEKAKKKKEEHKDSQRPAVSWSTIGAIGLAIKNIPGLVKNAFNFEERKKIQAARLTYGVAKWFGGWIALEALNSLDESIYSVISKFQSSLGGRESKDAGDVHAEAVSRRIKKEIFDTHTHLDPSMFKLKAAGYLLYSLEKGGHPYFRALNSEAHKGLRVKAILGQKHYEVFMRERQKFIDQVKSGPEDQILFDKLVKFELNYIHTTVDTEDMVKVFGSQFGKKVEGYKDKFGQGDAIDNIKSAMENKNNFEDYLTTFRWTLVKHTPATAMAALELMVESAGNDSQYSEVYACIVQLYASWLGTRSFGQSHKDRLKKIGRMAWIPLALMADDINAPYKVVAMIDYIADQAWIPPLSGAKSNEGKFTLWRRDNISSLNLTAWNGHKYAMEAILWRWKTGRNWEAVMDAFNYSKPYLLNYEQNATGEVKWIIDEYFDKRVFDSLTDTRFWHSDKLTLWGDSPFYSKGILNISPATFTKVMDSLDRNSWQFREPAAREMRVQFKVMMNQMNTELSNAIWPSRKFLLKLLLKKFALYFGSKYSSKELESIKEWLEEWADIDKAKDIINSKYTDNLYWTQEDDFDEHWNRIPKPKKKRGRGASNAYINDALSAMFQLFKDHWSEIKPDVIRYAFGR